MQLQYNTIAYNINTEGKIIKNTPFLQSVLQLPETDNRFHWYYGPIVTLKRKREVVIPIH